MANKYFMQFPLTPIRQLVNLHGSANLVAPVLAAITGQGITYTAVALGTAGNGIAITIVGGGTAGAEVVTVNSTARTVQIQVESGVSTRTQVKTAWDLVAAAVALATTSVVSGATVVTAAAAVTTTGGVNGVSGFTMLGVSNIAHTGTGLFTITLDSTYNAFMGGHFTILAATAVDLVPQMVSYDVTSAKTVVVRLNTGATPTNPAAAAQLWIHLALRNSSVAY